MRPQRFAAAVLVGTLISTLLAVSPGSAGADETWPWQNVRVSNDQWLAHSEPSIAIDPTNPDNLVGASKMFNTLAGGSNGYRFKIGTYYSNDGGETWVDQGMLGGNDPANAWTAEGYQNTTDPAVTFDSSGNAYVQILVYRGTGQDVGVSGLAGQNKFVVYKSTDKGKTWLPPVDIAHAPPGVSIVQGGDKNWLTADTSGGRFDGNLYATWTYTEVPTGVATQNIYFSASVDGGATWTRPHRILSTTASQLKQTSTPVVGPDGTIYVTYHDYVNSIIYMTKSADAGATWSTPTPVTSVTAPGGTLNGNVRSGPLVISVPAVLPNGKIVVVWNDAGGDAVDILMTTSTDGGATWSSPTTINKGTAGDQFQPWVTVTPGGTLWAMWLDRRDDPANMKIHVYAARSLDGGATWTEYRATDVASDPRIGLPLDRSNRGFYGDYEGLAADDQTGASLLFSDTRAGSQQLYFARVNPNASTVSATRGVGTIAVSGHAGFRGNTAKGFISEDATGDTPGGVAQTGLDVIGAKVWQPDPYVPRLAFEWNVTALPEPGKGQLPEVTRYLWAFNTGTANPPKQFQLQAKFSNFSSITMLDEQQGHVANVAHAFQLRGNCVTAYPMPPSNVANCPHVAWLTGHWDLTHDLVRYWLPIGASFAPEIVPGAVLKPQLVAGSAISASYQAAISNTTVSDVVTWEEESPFTIPTKEAFVGVAPTGTPAGQVTFSPVALGTGDGFSTTVTAGAGAKDVYLKTCFDGRCDITVTTVA